FSTKDCRSPRCCSAVERSLDPHSFTGGPVCTLYDRSSFEDSGSTEVHLSACVVSLVIAKREVRLIDQKLIMEDQPLTWQGELGHFFGAEFFEGGVSLGRA